MNHAPPTSAQPATCNAQPATSAPIQSAPELCYSGGVPVPPLKPDGTRPSPSCPGCHIRLYRLGFDVAASGQGDLAAIYIDQVKDGSLKLRALLTCRTEDWNFLKTALFYFMRKLKSVYGAGDESGLGRQICWEAATKFSGRFTKVNFASKKHDLGFALMNQLSNAEKIIPKNQPDIAADFFALRKSHTGTRWIFTEGRNTLNANSHCDIAWAAALASHAHTENTGWVGAAVIMDNGMIHYSDGRIVPCPPPKDFPTDPAKAAPAVLPTDHLLWSDDPNIWHRLR